MRFVLDAHMLGEAEGGNETYIAGLLPSLAPVVAERGDSLTALLGPRSGPMLDAALPVRRASVGQYGDAWRLFVQVRAACRREKADVVHMTYNAPPLLPCPLVLTVHDVSFRLYPEYFSPRVRILLSTLLSFSMREAKAILTVSECSRKDILGFYPSARGKIKVIPEAAGPVVQAIPDTAAARHFTGDRPFILTVGTMQPRKNLPRVIEAYLQLREQRVTDARLVIAGKSGWRTDALARLFANSDHRHDVIFTGYVTDSVLAALYRECAVFVYASLYEGFGLPVLEAMACGAPVITSNTSSLPEVAGDAARLVDPFSAQSIRAALENVLRDRHLQEELRGLGKRRASEFSWERTARETLAVYERVAGE